MSETIGQIILTSGHEVGVGVFCGPAGPADRRRIQLSALDAEHAVDLVLTTVEARKVAHWLTRAADGNEWRS